MRWSGGLSLHGGDGRVWVGWGGVHARGAGFEGGVGGLRGVEVPCHYVAEPVGHAAGDGVDCCVGGVDADSMLGEAEEGSLLGVGEGEGFQAAEDDWVCMIVLC